MTPFPHRARRPFVVLLAPLALVLALGDAAPVSASPVSASPGAPPDPERAPDSVLTKSGRLHTGFVVFEDDERVLLRSKGRLKQIEREQVERVDSTREAMRILLVHLYDARLGNLDVLKEIAQYAEGHGLHRTAQLFWWKALLREPEDDEALRALGGRMREGRRELPHEGSWWTLADLQDRTREWNHAWHLGSLHYDVRSSLGLHDTIDLLLDLEHFYFAFYAFLAPHLELHELLEPLRFDLHGERASFPEVGWSARSYFSPDQNVAIVNASESIDRATLLHEASHALLHNIARSRKRAEIPPWIDEGLAEYLRAGARGPLGRLEVRPGAFVATHFRRLDGDLSAADLSRVLNLAKGDYLASGNSEMRYAQSYTLVDYFLHGPDPQLPDSLFQFLGWCFEGRASPTHFKKVMSEGEEALEEGWREHVHRVAGGGAGGRRRVP